MHSLVARFDVMENRGARHLVESGGRRLLVFGGQCDRIDDRRMAVFRKCAGYLCPLVGRDIDGIDDAERRLMARDEQQGAPTFSACATAPENGIPHAELFQRGLATFAVFGQIARPMSRRPDARSALRSGHSPRESALRPSMLSPITAGSSGRIPRSSSATGWMRSMRPTSAAATRLSWSAPSSRS